jgi:hypothetical protein
MENTSLAKSGIQSHIIKSEQQEVHTYRSGERRFHMKIFNSKMTLFTGIETELKLKCKT